MDRRSFISSGIGLGAVAAGSLVSGKLARAFALDAKGTPGATVATTSGRIRGLSVNGVQAFRGVPYGASTEGANRFMPPAKPKPWTNVRDAFDLGLRSPQLDTQFNGVVIPEVAATSPLEPMGEDCLCLNLWTPGAVAGGKRPVMVWLHGGGYTTGSAGFTMYDGRELARKHDVVVVGVNHRLTIFGFLTLAGIGGEKYAAASNVGILDIVAALEWVRDNVSSFGGDPGNVTIFGQSGGGGKVSTLTAMPSAKGLFHRAIVESGSEIRGIPQESANKTAAAFLAKLDLGPNQIDRLQTLPLKQLLDTLQSMSGAGVGASDAIGQLGPVVDGRTLPANPFDPAASPISANIPMLIGTNETEVTFFANQILDPLDDAELHKRVKGAVRGADDTKVDALIAAYREGRPGISNIDLYLILDSDQTFRAGVITEAERKADAPAPVYQYYFTWRSPVRDGKLKAFHTLEIPFVFDNVDSAQSMTGTGQDRYALADKISSAWVAFARTGNPNHKGIPEWRPYTNAERAIMLLDNECKLVNDPHGAERRALRSA